MLFPFFKIAWRNLVQNRLISGLNILGLSIGIAAALLILQYVGFEKSFDRFYPNAKHVYRLTTWSGKEMMATTPPPLAETIGEKVPGVEAVCRVYKWRDFTMRPAGNEEKVFRETNLYAADESYFKVFGNTLLAGNPVTALRDPESAVLTQSAATRYFGAAAADPQQILGRTIIGGKDEDKIWKVTGIMKNQPANSHIQFEYLISSSSYPRMHRNRFWLWNIIYTYVLLPAGPTQEVLNGLERINTENILPARGITTGEKVPGTGHQATFHLQPLTDIHLHSHFLREMRPNGNNTYMQIFLVVAFFILLVACINYINLYTAQSARRAKEVGIKKAVGAGRGQLIRQFISESFLMTAVATGLAFIFIQLFQSVVVKSSGGRLIALEHIQANQMLWQGAALMFMVTLIAGIYPAMVLTKFRPSEVLKGNLFTRGKQSNLRNSLVVFQFVVSICLVAGTIVVHNQVELFKNTNPGFNRENVLVIQNDREIKERAEAFKAELIRHPGIISASFSSGIPGLQMYQTRDLSVEGESESENIDWYQMDSEHLQTLGIQLAAGEGFRKGFTSDSSGILLNETAVKKLGLHQPVGQYLLQNKGADDEERLQILGVMKDFSFESMRTEVKPLAIQFYKGFTLRTYVSVRLAPGYPESALNHIKATWKNFKHGVPLQYSYLEEDYNTLFESEVRMGKIFGFFTGLALLIACLGLFGLAVFITEQRTKEIGIRKVLGATTSGLVKLLSMDFLRLVLIACCIATPLAWYGMQRWLDNFAYRTDLHWWVFVLAGSVSMAVAMLIVGVQSVKAALANPIESLRNE